MLPHADSAATRNHPDEEPDAAMDGIVSFTYVTNRVSPEPWHSPRMDRVSNLVHASVVEGEGLA